MVTAAAAGAEPSSRADAKSSGRTRTWTDSSGEYKVRASLVEVVDGKVRLRKLDGKIVVVPLEKLSETDQQWLAKHAEARVSGPGPAAGRTAVEGEWPGWRGPNRDGKSPDKGLLRQWPPGGPPLLWKIDTLGKGFSSPSVSQATVYVTGESNERLWLFAFDLNGKPKWKVEAGPAWTGDYPGSRASPTIDSGNVYLMSGTGLVGCYDARTGSRKWARDAREFGGAPGGWGYAESVLIWENLAIFKPGGQNCIVALDKKTGRNVWATRGFAAGPEYSSCLAVVHNKLPLILTGTREGLVCVNPSNGAVLWGNRFAAGNVANVPTPAYSDGYVFWANGYGKGGLCVQLGPGGNASEAWTTRDMDCHHGGYVIDGGYIYGNHGGGWVCLELKTGRKQWQERAVGKGSLCWADGMLYLFGENGGRAALATCSPKGLEIKGEVKVDGDGPSWAHPVVVGGRLYLRYDTNLYCFDVKGR